MLLIMFMPKGLYAHPLLYARGSGGHSQRVTVHTRFMAECARDRFTRPIAHSPRA
jgi:hypothetical protein